MTLVDRPILVLVDHTEHGELAPASAQVLTAARTLTSGGIAALSTVATPDVAGLQRYGATDILIPELGGASPRVGAVVADALAAAAAEIAPAAILCTANYLGREITGRLGVTLSGGAVVDAISLEFGDGGLSVTKSTLAGAWTTTALVTRGTPVVAVRPGAYEALPADPAGETPTVREVPVTLSAEATGITVVSSDAQSGSGRVPLTEAQVVVVGGRGTDGDFGPVEALADLLGGAVGATRVCSDEGWVPRSLQIGQTGVNISPNLYIGLGVSGAIHHTAGMQSSAHIVAVCDDPDAPIFEMCDFGVVGDLFEVVPQAISAIEKARAGQ
ncbi:MAG: electron transfer flavoprotein subunit alpha/FixB family protein [Actinomycetaceae bacterium]|nr:electron transfer flavoprotein subunit alpha/FixB family protein [Actinomycetaceae bacterium]